jgi:hypothetical protein
MERHYLKKYKKLEIFEIGKYYDRLRNIWFLLRVWYNFIE